MARAFKEPEAWTKKRIALGSGGVDSSEPPQGIADDALSASSNLAYRFGALRSDTGLTPFLGNPGELPLGTYQFFLTNGASFLCLLTVAHFYKAENAQWKYVGNVNTTLSVAGVATDTVINVTATAGIAVGDSIGVALDTLQQHQSTVTAIGTGTVTIADALPSGAALANAFVRTPTFTGMITHPAAFVTFSDTDWLIFSNGVDPIYYFDGIQIAVVPGLPLNTTCASVAIYHFSLVLANTTENGTAYPQRVRRSAPGNAANWTTNGAGYDDLTDTEDFILAAVNLGPWLILYREQSVERISFLGEADNWFLYEYMLYGIGASSSGAVINAGGEHYFLSDAGIYRYTGGYDATDDSLPVYSSLFSAHADVNPGLQTASFGFYVGEYNEVWFFYASSSANYPDTLLILSLDKKTFFRRTFPFPITGYGFYAKVSSPTWADLPGTWADYPIAWNARVFQSNVPIYQLCGESGQVYSYDFLAVDDAGTPISWTAESKDFVSDESWFRVWQVQVMGIGPFSLWASFDGGQSWMSLGNQVLGPEASVGVWAVNRSAQSFRVRLTGTGSASVNWIELQYKPERRW